MPGLEYGGSEASYTVLVVLEQSFDIASVHLSGSISVWPWCTPVTTSGIGLQWRVLKGLEEPRQEGTWKLGSLCGSYCSKKLYRATRLKISKTGIVQRRSRQNAIYLIPYTVSHIPCATYHIPCPREATNGEAKILLVQSCPQGPSAQRYLPKTMATIPNGPH